ncbi:CheR family methyltransferase [Candidatus Thiodictyon syntrophicum]|uniref:CheR-type methyltransferase domain-containing protein n=1 Tax=Candidatus Thiodictyon syntrophicum TaxID=1166950 RepID=A0A2K8U5E9_9GAMM|nr:CheR family methyltransferase [Candidatus Thiodictyon syntrophicum]AUB80261.1 hypothetical protein THSYN_04320 [Candidatus Thiodictyon syntrophicum]
MNLEAARGLLQVRLGLRLEGQDEARLQRAVQQRMTALGMDAGPAYLAQLHTDATELTALAGLLTIKETYFYREPQHLRLLTGHLAPLLLRGRAAGVPVRILSAGCATGEEPYSIAIALRERYAASAARLFRIEAVDLDPQAIASARAGRYRPYALRALDPDLKARWFTPAPDGTHQVTEPIRQGVAFRPLNLVADPYPDALHGQDLIFYRNLSIYFDAATRAAVLRRLRTLLRPGGYLIVGLAETLANGFGIFALCEREGVWYFANAAAEASPPPPPTLPTAGPGTADRCPPPVAPPAPAMVPLPADPGPARDTLPQAAGVPAPILDEARREAHRSDHEESYRQALALARAERFAAALEVLAPLCAAPRALPLHLRLLAQLLLEGGDQEGAAAAARRVLALDAWSVDALVLLGRIARAQGDLGEAVAHLRRAIYARPDHWPAHLELAQCRAADGHPEAARREYRIALRLLGEAGPTADQTGPLPAALPVADLRHLCRARLARLGEPT